MNKCLIGLATIVLPLFANHMAIASTDISSLDKKQQEARAKQVKRESREPEGATGFFAKEAVHGQKFMVAAANPYASQAGFDILKKGGSAVDAAIAVQLVLSLVEPQSSGIGGGTFMLHWHNEKKQLTTFDGRETAPQEVTSDLFLAGNGKPLKWVDAVVGGKSVGVPGLLAALKKSH